MIPLRAARRTRAFTPATWVFAGLGIAVMVRLSTLRAPVAQSVLHGLAVVPARLLGSWSAGQTATLLTSVFLHAGWVHLAGNALFLIVFGPAVEERLGWRGFSAVYFASGVAGGLTYVFANPSSAVPLVGASGAIAGVLGAHLVLEPRARITTLVPAVVIVEIASLPAAFVIALWFVLQVASAVSPVAPTAAGAGVAWVAHIVGFATGGALATPFAIAGARNRKTTRIRPTNTGGNRRRAA